MGLIRTLVLNMTVVDCPVCNGTNTVKMEHIFDFTLYDDGTIMTDLSGICSACGTKFWVE